MNDSYTQSPKTVDNRPEPDERDAVIEALQRKLNQNSIELALFGKAPGRLVDAFGAGIGVSFESEYFIVASFDLHDKSELFDANGRSMVAEAEVHMVKELIFSSFEEYLGHRCIAYCCESNRYFGDILLNIPDISDQLTAAQAQRELLLESEKALEAIERYCGVRLCLAMSQVVSGFSRLPRAKHEAYASLEELLSSGGYPRVVGAKAVQKSRKNTASGNEGTKSPDTLRTGLERQFFQSLIRHRFDESRQILEGLVAIDMDMGAGLGESAKMVRLHLESIMGIIGRSGAQISDMDAAIEGVTAAADFTKLSAAIEAFFLSLDSGRAEPSSDSSIRLIKRYVEENYTDCNICLGNICDRYGVNQSYVSRTFKTLFGVGILEYIHSLRIDKAKAMLKGTGKKVDEIYPLVGYTNRRTFDRTFKQVEGMTAVAYRSAIKGEGQTT